MELIESLFKLKDHKTSFRKEVLAGLATFLTMAYIMVVNPAILSETGMDFDSVFVATILASFVACMLMGILANWPVALAPGASGGIVISGCKGYPLAVTTVPSAFLENAPLLV